MYIHLIPLCICIRFRSVQLFFLPFSKLFFFRKTKCLFETFKLAWLFYSTVKIHNHIISFYFGIYISTFQVSVHRKERSQIPRRSTEWWRPCLYPQCNRKISKKCVYKVCSCFSSYDRFKQKMIKIKKQKYSNISWPTGE